ncbi:MAG: hypothetical protein Q9212_006561 [Teloschistes hypoglaucus]
MSVPTTPPTPSLFLKLPPEVRVMIYKWHFLQAPEHPTDACSQTSICETCVPGLGCDNASFNGGAPIGNLLAVAQCIYREVAPLYTRLHQREFEDLEDMRRYLSNSGPCLRHHILSVKDVSYLPLRYQPRDPPGTAELVQTQQDLTSSLQILCTASTPQENQRREAADQGFGIIGGRRIFSLPEAN